MPPFIPGRELSRRFYDEAVRPILLDVYPRLAHAAGHLGSGSDVLGFDTEMSRDHDWGPSVTLVLAERDAGLIEPLRTLLAERLPRVFLGYPAGFIDSPDEPGTDIPATSDSTGPLRHHVFPTTLRRLTAEHLGWSYGQPLEPADWLSIPSQRLRSMVEGAIHHDDSGELTELAECLAWYPRDVWLYLLACGWQRIGQEDHLMSRAGYVGDELGSALIGSRLARDAMTLCFLYERRYAPYPKWFGSAFQQLVCAGELTPLLWRAQTAVTWREREAVLGEVMVELGHLHNRSNLTLPLETQTRFFFSRPFQVIQAERYVTALLAEVRDPLVGRLLDRPLIGGVDQFSDNTDLRSNPLWRPWLRRLYE